MSTYKTSKLLVQEGCSTFLAMQKRRLTKKSDAETHHPADQIEVGRRIHVLLAALGWSATQLAAAVGITPQKLNNYTSGRNKLPPAYAAAICTATGVDFDYLHRGLIDRLSPDLQAKIIEARNKVAA